MSEPHHLYTNSRAELGKINASNLDSYADCTMLTSWTSASHGLKRVHRKSYNARYLYL